MRPFPTCLHVASFVALLGGCLDDASQRGAPTGAEDGLLEPAAGSSSCPRPPGAETRDRWAVVSHPYGAGGAHAKAFEVLELSAEGTLSRVGRTFQMGRAFGEIAFTPDGKVGLVAQDDGTVGAFVLGDDGSVRVTHEAFKGDFYARRVLVSPDGRTAYVVDEQTAEHGGGIHALRIACDGTLSQRGLVLPGDRAHAMAFFPNDPTKAVVVAVKTLDSPEGAYIHRVSFGSSHPARVASTPVFADEGAIASWVSVTPDGKYALVTDNAFGVPGRMAAVKLGGAMAARTAIPTPHPAAVVMSPFGNAALLLNSDGSDALRVVAYDPDNSRKPFSIAGEVAYVGGETGLPTTASVVERGSLKGHVFVGEFNGVRHLTFTEGGGVIDLGPLTFAGYTGMVGALGVQP